eukprot:TRINITY_DN941_c1_g1_i1.p1 TRINITY_DN941_c1_g1~~TRINITY_DN941_c1_g1_i1.p1  ORF type:complete len:468 (-),score=66.37 TRINITY_DN941_c1_g1_i1:154-1557(-)
MTDNLATAFSSLSVAPNSTPTTSTNAEKLRHLPQFIEDLKSANIDGKLAALTAIRKLLSIERNPPISEVISTGVVPTLVSFMQPKTDPRLQFEAVWSLTNIASGTTSHTKAVIDAGAVPLFVRLVSSASPEVSEQAIWALGNLAGDSWVHRDLVLSCGGMQSLIELGTNPLSLPMSTQRNLVWTLSNCCRGKPPPDFSTVKKAIPVVAKLLTSSTDDEVLTDSAWALSYLSDDSQGSSGQIDAVINSGVVPRLVELLSHNATTVQSPALRTLGNIVTGDETQTNTALEAGILRPLGNLATSRKKAIRKEAFWAISNITAGNSDQIQAVIDEEIFPKLISAAATEEADVAKEAAFAIANACIGGTRTQLNRLVDLGAIKALVCCVGRSYADHVISNILDGLNSLAESVSDKSTIRDQLLDDNDSIRTLAAKNDRARQLLSLLESSTSISDSTTATTSDTDEKKSSSSI